MVEKDSILYYINNAKGKNQLKELQRAVDLAEKIQHDSLIRETNIKFGLQSYFKKKAKNVDIAQQRLKRLYRRSQDSFALAKVHHYKALFHLLNFRSDSALYYYVESKNISIRIKDSLEVGRRLLSMANIQRDGKDHLGSEISAIEGLRYLEPIKDYRYTGFLYTNLGLLSSRAGKYEEARMYMNKAQEINEKNPNRKRKIRARLNYFNNMGISYINEGNYDKAISFFKEGLAFDSIAIKFRSKYYLLVENLSDAYILQKKPEKAFHGLKEANELKVKNNDTKGLSTSHNLLSKYYYAIHDEKNALYHAKKGLVYAKKSKHLLREIRALEFLAKSTIISRKTANGYLKKYIRLSDSLYQQERTIKNQFARIRFETDKKEKENTVLKNDNEKKQLEIAQEKQQKTIGFLVAIGSLLLLGISVLVFKHRKKKLAFDAQLQQVAAREEERQQIAKSLHDEVAGDLRMLHHQLEKDNQITIAQTVDAVKNNVRNLSHQLSSVNFEEVSFTDQIVNLVSDYFSSACKISIRGLKENEWSVVENAIKRTLYLCLRESVQNACKYAKATQINIGFKLHKNNVYLRVQDNGVGFNVSEKSNGIGLKNQQERIQELSGKIAIQSDINKGTTIQIEIPIHV